MTGGVVWSAVFVAAAALCLAALVRHRLASPAGAAAEANHVVMAVAMAVMAAPGGMDVVPPAVGTALFTALGACWLVRLVVAGWRGTPLGSPIGHARCAAHPTHLLLVNAAMVAMYVPMLGGGAMAGMDHGSGEHAHHGGGGSPGLLVLSAGLAIYLLVHAAATVAALVSRSRAAGPTAVESAERAGSVGSVAPVDGGSGAVATLAPAPARPRLEVLTAPRTQLVCQAVMGVGMAAMLLLA